MPPSNGSPPLMALVLVTCCGALLVLSGQLSRRKVLDISSPEEPPPDEALVDQVMLVVVDAMRPDFIFPSLRQFASRGGLCGDDGEVIGTADGHGAAYNGPWLTYLESTLQAAVEARSTACREEDQLVGKHTQRLGPSTTPSPPAAVGLFLVADAPTTTAQRLKAISTGVVPAFIEAGSNFNSDRVADDSLVAQARRLSVRRKEGSVTGGAVVVGDDTWLSLYPAQLWKRTAVFPSFDVRDLDSNDIGVEAQLEAILADESPTSPHAAPLVIAHFLGIDHAGHRFNAQNLHMDRKIVEIDASLRGISTTLSKRAKSTNTTTMLLVLGDHGMTNSGDHGGDAPQETDTFLFAQLFGGTHDAHATSSPLVREQQRRRFTAACEEGNQQVDPELCRLWGCGDAALLTHAPNGGERIGATRQVDVVPTIASLLAMAIPFSNVGRVIPEVIHLAGGTRMRLRAALERNHAQMGRYLAAIGGSKVVASQNEVDDVTAQIAAMSSWVRSSTHIRVGRMWVGMTGLLGFLALLTPRLLVASKQSPPCSRRWWAVALGCGLALFTWIMAADADGATDTAVLGGLMLTIVVCSAQLTGALSPSHTSRLAHLLSARKAAVPTLMVASLVLVRVIVPLSNSLVVFEDRVIGWLFPLTIALITCVGVRPPSHRQLALGVGLCVALRAMSVCVRSRRHHTHVMDDLSPLEGWIGVWVPTTTGSGFFDAYSLKAVAGGAGHPSLIAAALILRCVLNAAVVVRWAPPSHVVGAVLFSVCEGIPVVHHVAALGLALWSGHRGDGVGHWGLLFGASLCTGLGSRVAATGIGWAAWLLAEFLSLQLSGPDVAPVVVVLCAFAIHLLGWACFFHSGLQTTVSSLDWNAAFVGVPSYNMAVCGALTILRCVFPHAASSLAVFTSLRVPRVIRRKLLFSWVYLAALVVGLSCCACVVHKVHLMMWTIFCPKAVFDVAVCLVTVVVAAMLGMMM